MWAYVRILGDSIENSASWERLRKPGVLATMIIILMQFAYNSTCYFGLLLFFNRKKDEKDDTKTKVSREEKKRTREAEKAMDQDEDGWETVERKSTRVLNQQELKLMLFGKEVDEINHDVIKKRRDEIVAPRGKKTVDRNSSIENLKLLLRFSDEAHLGVGMELMLLVDLVATIFDIPSAASCMKDDIWERCALYGVKSVYGVCSI